MRTFVILAASALLFAAAVVEISSRLWPDSYLALLTLAALALYLQGLLGSRVIAGRGVAAAGAGTGVEASAPATSQPRERKRQPRDQARSGDAARSSERTRSSERARSADRGRDKAPRKEEKASRQSPEAAPAPAKAATATPAAAGDRENGTVKWFNRSKGFGFIIRESGEEIFVHQRSIRAAEGRRGALRDGQAVTFVVAERDKGLQAEDVEGQD